MNVRARIDELQQREGKHREMGGADRLARQT